MSPAEFTLELLWFTSEPARMKSPRWNTRGSSVVSFLFLLTADVVQTRGELIASDDFEYDSTLIRSCNGGIGWIDAWTGGNLVTVGSLRYGDYPAKGHKLTTNGGTVDSLRCSFRTIATRDQPGLRVNGKFGKPGTTLWMAFIANVPTGRSTGFGGISLCDNRREQIFFGDTGASVFWGIELDKKTQVVSTVAADEATVFLVYRMRFRTDDTQVEMWINPPLGEKEPNVADVAVAALAAPFRFNCLRICSNPVPLSIDGLRIGTAYG